MKVRQRKHYGYHSWRRRLTGYVAKMRRRRIVVHIRFHSKCGRAGVDMEGAR